MADVTRRALVTGAGSGIGAATARRLATEGWAVGCADVDLAAAERTAGDLDAAVAIRCDVRSPDDCRAAARAAADGGALEAVVTCAGIEVQAPPDDLDDVAFADVLDVNLTGTYRTVHAALPYLRDAAAVVLIGSVNSQVALAGQAAYCASKGGVLMLGRALAVDLAPRGVRVNVVGPGVTDTPMSGRSLRDPVRGPALLARSPLGRAAQPHEIAAAIAFLVGRDASYVTGAYLPVDGGWLAHG